MHTHLPELIELEQLITVADSHVQVSTLCKIDTDGQQLPVYALTMGSDDPQAPLIGFFGGVHGLERIGTQVVLAYLEHLIARLRWDRILHQQLTQVRLLFVPLANPGGFWRRTRANPHGVDLMRNSPVVAREPVPFLLGGQRYSPNLPWYQGQEGAPMELETAALCALLEREISTRRFSLTVDCHSGFGSADRIWFPYAHSREPIAHVAELHALNEILEQSHRHHPYIFEPQCLQYLTHGDLWDHLYLRSLARPENCFLPLTLEMGSWLWVKKNPLQLFSRHGLFNPLIAHRQQRVLRRHIGWLDFLTRATIGHTLWCPQGEARADHDRRARQRWFSAG